MKFELVTNYEGPLLAVTAALTSKRIYELRGEAIHYMGPIEFGASGAPGADGSRHTASFDLAAEELPKAVRAFFTNGVRLQVTGTVHYLNEGTTTAGPAEALAPRGVHLKFDIDVVGAPVVLNVGMVLAGGEDRTAAKVIGEVKVKVPFLGARIEQQVVGHLDEVLKKDVALVERVLAERAAG